MTPLETIIASVLSGGSIWGFLQFVLGLRARKQQHAKDEESLHLAKREARDAEEQRIELLAEAQATAQRTALDSAKDRFDALDKDYRECREGLREIRGVAFLLVDAMNMTMGRVRPTGDNEYTAVFTADEITKARFAIEQARERLYK